MRNAFVQELVAAAEKRDDIALVVGDLGYGVVEPFAQRFPRQFFNAGVAEQNMMGLSAGLASEGFHVFVYSIANFPTFRCAEQIRNDVDYHGLSVTVVSVGGGLAYGNLGYSHHAVQDYALMRVMPNMTIAAPGDPMQVRACMRHLLDHPGPSYLRLGKAGEPPFHEAPPQLEPGFWVRVSGAANASKTVLCTGATMEMAHQWVAAQSNPGAWAVNALPLWGMSCKPVQSRQVALWQTVITMEDHLSDAGFGSWMMEALQRSPHLQARIEIRALSAEVCGMVGKQSTLNRAGGLP